MSVKGHEFRMMRRRRRKCSLREKDARRKEPKPEGCGQGGDTAGEEGNTAADNIHLSSPLEEGPESLGLAKTMASLLWQTLKSSLGLPSLWVSLLALVPGHRLCCSLWLLPQSLKF